MWKFCTSMGNNGASLANQSRSIPVKSFLPTLQTWPNKGKVRFKEIDISTPEGEELANTYQVSWSSLYINQWKDGKEQRNDMTRLGFQYAKNKTDHFKQEIRKKINQLL